MRVQKKSRDMQKIKTAKKLLIWFKMQTFGRRGLVAIMCLVLLAPIIILPPQKAHAAIAYRSSSTLANSANGTTATITKPASVASGDVLIVTIASYGGPNNYCDGTLTGWTTINYVSQIGGGAMCSKTMWRAAGGSEPASYVFNFVASGANRTLGMSAYTGVDNTNPIDNNGASESINSGLGGTTATATGFTTVALNTMLVASFVGASNTANGTGSPSMTERYDVSGTGVTVSSNSQALASAGATGNKTSTVTGTIGWAGDMVALAPVRPGLEQSAYRFSVNADNNTPAFIADNLSAADDTARGTAFDPVNSMFFTVGDNGTNWVIEKRRIADGALCTSTNCGTTFGTAGRVTHDIASSATEKAYDLDIDPAGGFIYIVGMDNAAGAGQWHIQKRDMMSGALITSFDGDGSVVSNPSSGLDEATTLQLDTINNYLYVGGYDNIGANDNSWSLRKYRTDNGAICTAANCGILFGTAGSYTFDPSNKDDRISAIETDPTNTYLYLAGYTTAPSGRTDWKMQKMLASSAALCTAVNCGTEFGTAGTYTSDPTARDDQILALQVDSASGAIYISGFEQDTTNSKQWRIEKITLGAGTLVAAFGGSGCTTNIAGAICQKFTTNGDDKIFSMELDGAGGFIYVLGIKDEAGSNSEWRVQKRNRSDGSLVTAWATSGTATINPSVNKDLPASIVIDVERGLMWAVGGDRTLGTSNMQWYFTQLQLDTGTLWLAPQDTVAGASTSITFRLRLLLHISVVDLIAGEELFKLQYAPKVGTCDTGFVGESYADVLTSGSGEIIFHDNPSNSDAIAAVTLTGDPTHSSDTKVLQTIEEANNFTNTANVLNGQDGLWDFVLKDNNAFGAYCFKVVYSTGVNLTTYSVMPEVTFCKDDPKTSALLRHGTFFCEGIKKSFFWTQ